MRVRPGARRRIRLLLTPACVAIGLLMVVLYVAHAPARLGDDEILSRSFLGSRLRQHIELSSVAFVIASGVGVPAGILLAEAGGYWQTSVFLLANLGQAVPSVAILALTFTITGLGFKTTIVALVLYALLPILRNTVAGIRGIDGAVVEAARGMGMTRRQRLLHVQLPLTTPVIFAGLRTAMVLVIGTATLGNFVGGGGLGDVIAAGITSGRDRIVLVGTALVAALALLADWGLSLAERALAPRT